MIKRKIQRIQAEKERPLIIPLKTISIKINDLNRLRFVYDRLAPLGSLAYNPDDGLFSWWWCNIPRVLEITIPHASFIVCLEILAFNKDAF